MPAVRIRLLAMIVAALVSAGTVGCDRDETASNQPSATIPPPRESEAESDGPLPDDADTPAGSETPTRAPKAPAVASPDVPTPPTVDGEVMKNGFIFYSAKDKPNNVAAFYQKEMVAKGWKLGRNDSKDVGSGLVGVVQQYTKGNDVVTVALVEQLGSDQNTTTAQIMDIPLPPTATQVVPMVIQVQLSVPEAPDATLAWFAKELGARGWTARPVSDQGSSKGQSHTKAGRSINLIALGLPGNKGSSVTLQHIAAAE